MPLVAQLETLAALVTAPPGVLAALMLAALGAPSAGSASAALSQSHCPRQLLSRSSHSQRSFPELIPGMDAALIAGHQGRRRSRRFCCQHFTQSACQHRGQQHRKARLSAQPRPNT